jgi:membrane protein DedA with SNARE-associated domain
MELSVDGFFLSFLGRWSYLGLFLVLLAAGLGLPLPEDIPLVAAGWLVHHGGAHLYGMIAVGLVGVLVGDTILFTAGRRYGMHLVEHRWLRWVAKPWLVERARARYQAHGAKIMFAARFMPGLRSALFLIAGTFRIPYWKFLLIDGSAALISVPTWILLSYKFSGDVEALLRKARFTSYMVAAVVIVAVVAWILWEYYHNLRKREVAQAELQSLLNAAEANRTDPSAGPASEKDGGVGNKAKAIIETSGGK